MKKTNEIELYLQSAEQMLLHPQSLFYPNRILNSDAEEFLTEEAAKQPRNTPIDLKVHLPPEAVNRVHEIETAIHQHFAYLRKRSERKVKHTVQVGWRSLLIAIVFLSLLIALTTFAVELLPAGGFAITFREILVILGWVALWRPADFLLYEWRPFKREANLFGRLEKCKVEIYEKQG